MALRYEHQLTFCTWMQQGILDPGHRLFRLAEVIDWEAVTAVLGAWLGGFAFAFSSWPSRRWRAVLAFASGVAGAVMLGFHCDSSSWAHIIFGHLAQGLVVGAAIFGVLELVFHRGLRARLPWLRSARRLG